MTVKHPQMKVEVCNCSSRHMSLMLLTTLKIVSCLKQTIAIIMHDNTHLVNLLYLPQKLQKHVVSEYEYQLQLECDILLNQL